MRTIAIVFLSLLAPGMEAAESSGSTPLTADDVIARYVDALGGSERINSVRTLIIRGTYIEGEHRFEGTLAKMRPYYKLVGDPDGPPADFAEGYDGSAWEYYGNPGIVLRTVGPAAAATRHSTSILGALIGYADQGSTVTLLGTDTVAGRKAYRLRVRMRDGFEQDEFIDAETSRLIAERFVAPIHAFGGKISTETRWSDFRRVDGLLVPFMEEQVEIGSGKVLNQFARSSVVVNQDLEPRQFAPPSFERTPVQQFIEALFVTRDDPDAALGSYFDYRRAHPGEDTSNPVQIASYQILKMGQSETSIRLLRQNIKDYPDSSSAAFGLGRAYAAAGRNAEARTAFERALVLDPKNARAEQALTTLD
jgi:hypothetical protein